LKPKEYLNGVPWNGQFNIYYIPNSDPTALFPGDLVKTPGGADPTGIYPIVTQAAAGNTVRGVVLGFGSQPEEMYDVNNLMRSYRAGNDIPLYVAVIDDPSVVFEIQEDSVGGALTAANVGDNGNVVVGAGSTLTGASGMQLQSSDVIANTIAAHQLRILGLVNRVDNALGVNAKWRVKINLHELLGTAGT
jgi:hypothetical protein